MAQTQTPSVDDRFSAIVPEVVVTVGSHDTWQVVCGCGYRAVDITDRVLAHLVAATHSVATCHIPA